MKPQSWLAPLTPIYAAALHGKNAAYDRGLIRQKRLHHPVVSIGNLSTGGGGKTPFVIALAKLLLDADIPVDILSRGYGRMSDAVERVDPSSGSSADRYGDEPLLIARSVPVPVYIGRLRLAAGELAEQHAIGRVIHLLDDGFQHRQLARELDIVLLHREDLSTRLLPAGHLREPLSALRRADVVVLREEDRALESQIRRYLAPATDIWHMQRRMLVSSSTEPALAFCGIARPDDFFTGLRASGATLTTTLAYPDHHRFAEADVARLCSHAKLTAASRFLTTEKDLARLSSAALAQLQNCGPVESVPLQLTIVEAEAAVAHIRKLLQN